MLNKYFVLLSVLKTVVLLLNIFVETNHDKEQYIFEIAIYCNIAIVFTVILSLTHAVNTNIVFIIINNKCTTYK